MKMDKKLPGRSPIPISTFEDVLVCDLVLMALLFLSLSTKHVVFCVLRVLAVFGLNATLIFSLDLIIIIKKKDFSELG